MKRRYQNIAGRLDLHNNKMYMHLIKSTHAAVDSLLFNRGKNNSLILSFTKSDNNTLLS